MGACVAAHSVCVLTLLLPGCVFAFCRFAPAANLASLANDAYEYGSRARPGAGAARVNNCVLVDVLLRGWPALVLVTADPLAQGEELLAKHARARHDTRALTHVVLRCRKAEADVCMRTRTPAVSAQLWVQLLGGHVRGVRDAHGAAAAADVRAVRRSRRRARRRRQQERGRSAQR
jgi:hypothetical protein